MENKETPRKRRSQRDYTMAFKLQEVNQVEKGEFTYKQAQKIKRLERENEDLRLLNSINKETIELVDKMAGTDFAKKRDARLSEINKKRGK